ncbi:DUF397 domain-containing protein [Saccharopolyspora flava]|uniref:DUF397 domain-containing protein n=1 Tax=Saccharopolyspora flava TaxID=95161 RepID=UPI000B83332D|nr:DUF397 domain-containing protein [Saccharopolyspora flava]
MTTPQPPHNANHSRSCVRTPRSRPAPRGDASERLANATWRKSSRSANAGQCVEVAITPTTVGIRDSKNPGGDHLTTAPTQWASFLTTLKAGRYDR